jgi:GNAT superfamily N-acetyltransferase
LPADHVIRAPRPEADAEGILGVMVARDIADIGQPDVTLEDVRAFWATPGVELAQDAWVVEAADGELVASGQLLGDDALIFVHPDACGRGIGTALRERAEGRARERGTAVLRQFQPVGNAGASALLMAADYWPAQQ